MTPEQKARQKIDRMLQQSGWIVQDPAEMNISAGLGVAIREFPLKTCTRRDRLLQSILKRAFEGKLIPQGRGKGAEEKGSEAIFNKTSMRHYKDL